MPNHRIALAAGAVLGALILGAVSASSEASGPDAQRPRGGTFRIAFAPPEQLDTMDPALANTQASWSLLDLTCARLMTYPDKAGKAAYRLEPEVAAARPRFPATARRTRSRSGAPSASVTTGLSPRRRSHKRSTARSRSAAGPWARSTWRTSSVRAQCRRAGPEASVAFARPAVTGSWSGSSGRWVTSRSARACRSSARCRRTCPPIRRDAVSSRARAPTTWTTTGLASGSRSRRTPITVVSDGTTSRAIRST